MRLVFLLAAVLAAFVTILPAYGRNDGRWNSAQVEVRQWFRQQIVPGGQHKGNSCCNEADGEEVEEDIRDGHYWIRGGHFVDWTLVPDEVVIHESNPHGQPVAWFYYLDGKAAARCYAPGAGI